MIPDGGVTSAKGFLAGATYAGLKTQGEGVLDVGILLSEVPATLAATFSTNKILSPSVTLSRERAGQGTARGVIANSGCANCCVGEQGLTDAKEMADLAAEHLAVNPMGQAPSLVADDGLMLHRRHVVARNAQRHDPVAHRLSGRRRGLPPALRQPRHLARLHPVHGGAGADPGLLLPAHREEDRDQMTKRLTDFKVLTFDTYGTLIDWESGIFNALKPLLENVADEPGRDAVLEIFAQYETAQERATPDKLYPELLSVVHAQLRSHWGADGNGELDQQFGQSVAHWPAFPDSAESLAYLKQHYQLVILSNIDRGSFAASNEKLGVEFDAIYTAEDIGSYKPDPRNFEYLLEHLIRRGVDKADILHTAQSQYHDIVPATELGIATMWIERRHGKESYGATPKPEKVATPTFHATSMADFVRQVKEER
ncbi:MAG: haloacid dehalogenase type II [Proteobacteria bacterium]|nr:haloacid dehalogenase type II [Pseudomonadota bacterium]